MAENLARNINEGLRSWIMASQKLRKSASLCYGKIRASIASLEPMASRAMIQKLQSEAGRYQRF